MLRYFRPRVRTRHPSHSPLRPKYKNLPLFPFRSIIRLGSFTELRDNRINRERVELNTVEAISNSADKLRMKKRFYEDNVKTAKWFTVEREGDEVIAILYDEPGDVNDIQETDEDFVEAITNRIGFPIVSKHVRGSRGRGNRKHDDMESLINWMEGKDLSNYIFEKYYSYNREYRLHVDAEGCFYACRKMLKSDAPQEVRWYRNDDHCVWILEDNEMFDKPVNWDSVVEESVKALNAVGLDFGAIDLRIQSAKDRAGNVRENPEFIVVEINSAPSFGEKTAEVYIRELPRILNNKYNANR